MSERREAVAKLKDYRYFYFISSYTFDIACHILSITAQDSVPLHISLALSTVLALVFSVYELSDQRRQALPLITSYTGIFVDIALEGTVGGAFKPTIP